MVAYKNAVDTFNEADIKLKSWHLVRPFLYVASCPYARSLVVTMIDCYEFLLAGGYEHDSERLQRLKDMLNRLPPNFDPPASGSIF